jgi:hypothetical protein
MNDKLDLFTKWCDLSEGAICSARRRRPRRQRRGAESVVLPAESFECGCELHVRVSRPDYLECGYELCEQHTEWESFLHGVAVGVGVDCL